jgi:hypothetical protein
LLAGTCGLLSINLIQLSICKTISALLFARDPFGSNDFWAEFARSGVEALTALSC